MSRAFHIYIYIYRQDFALHIHQELICHKTKEPDLNLKSYIFINHLFLILTLNNL